METSNGARTSDRRWSVLGAELAPELPLREKLLRLRGLPPGAERERFLIASPHTQLPRLLGDPLTLPDAEATVSRLADALRHEDRICVYGDYDADGVTATAILVRGLRELGGHVGYYIPHRVHEGFGLNEAAVRKVAAGGYRVLVTADCGTAGLEEVTLAQSLGLDVIITDHHTLPVAPDGTGTQIPDALAVVNPRRNVGAYAYRELTGAGVAYMLLRALVYRVGALGIRGGELVQLAAVGAVGDVAPLTGENRLLVRAGLVALNTSPLPGLGALAMAAGLTSNSITETDIGFKLAPRLNAAGRMDHANLACDLLLETDLRRAVEQARRLETLNRGRRSETDGMLVAAAEMVDTGDALRGDVLTVYREDWSPALLGIVAGRLSRLHSVPVVAASGVGNAVRASARSMPGLNIIQALEGCAHLLTEHGGHSQAAGFTTSFAGLAAVHEHLSTAFAGTRQAALIEVDLELGPADISSSLGSDLMALAPFGSGNPEPLFGLRDVPYRDVRVFGKARDHLGFRIPAADGADAEVIAWGMADQKDLLTSARTADLVVRADRQSNGTYSPLRFCAEHIFPNDR